MARVLIREEGDIIIHIEEAKTIRESIGLFIYDDNGDPPTIPWDTVEDFISRLVALHAAHLEAEREKERAAGDNGDNRKGNRRRRSSGSSRNRSETDEDTD